MLSNSTSQPIAADSNPVVTAYPAGSPTDGTVPAAALAFPSATDGSYVLTKLPAGSYDVYFNAEGFAPRTVTGVTVTANTDTSLGTIKL